MGAKRRIADRHQRTRSDHASETAEDYVEAIAEVLAENGRCRIMDLARRFAVSHVTVSKTVSRLQREGYVETEPYGPVQLTDRGRRLAGKSRQRHEIVLNFLLALGVSEATAVNDAEGIEHHVSSETLQRMHDWTIAALSTRTDKKCPPSVS